MIYAAQNLRFLLTTHKIDANDFDKIIGWSRGTASRYQNNISKSPPLAECITIVQYFKISLDDFIFNNLENLDNLENIDSGQMVNESMTPYTTTTEGGLNNLKMELIETERQLYERIIQSKEEHIKTLERLLAEMVKT